MPHACHRFWNCYKTLTFCSLLTRCIILCACHAKRNLNIQKCSAPLSYMHFWLRSVLRATTPRTFSTSQLLKAPRSWSALYILTLKCASPQACTFSTSQLPKVLWTRQFFTLLTWKCASRHNGLQLFISHLTTWLRTRRFSEPSFRPSGATNHWKNRVVRDFPTYLFAHLDETFLSFFLLRLSLFWFFFLSLTLPISAFHLSTLSEVWLLPSKIRHCHKMSKVKSACPVNVKQLGFSQPHKRKKD